MTETIDIARFKRDGISYLLIKEDRVQKYLKNKLDKQVREFILKNYIKEYCRGKIITIKKKYQAFKKKCEDIKFRLLDLRLPKIKRNIRAYWLFWRL